MAGSGGAVTSYSPTSGIPIAFVDNDNTLASLRLLRTLATSPDFHEIIQSYNEQSAIAALGSKKFYAVIVVPKGFQDNLDHGNEARVMLYTDDSEPGMSGQIDSTLTIYVQRFNGNLEFQPILTNLQKSSTSGVEMLELGCLCGAFNIGLTVVLAVVQIFAVFYEIAGGIAHQRETGTFARLLISPVHAGSIIVGITIFDLLLSVIRTFIVLGLSMFVYGASPNTDLGTILILSLLIALVTMGLGFAVASFRVGTRAVVIMEFFLVLFLFAFSGLWVDVELFFGITRIMAYILPYTYAYDALKRTILLGTPLHLLTIDLEVLVGSTIILYAISYLLFRYSRERLAS
ncbi:MAG TPA: ABC transporter permease [Candidatus Saccharimonadales bacterium]|nr:ABC transporter permease [Candidatus Saccharimonadales bacterium]